MTELPGQSTSELDSVADALRAVEFSAHAPSTFPSSEIFELRETEHSGRGVFATANIVDGTPILVTDLVPSHVVYREYRREVCARCFAYDGSRALKLRVAETGNAFCGKSCLREWKADAGPIGLEAWTAMESFIKSNGDRAGGRKSKSKGNNMFDSLPDDGADRPTEEEIREAWETVQATAELIHGARKNSREKVHRKALQSSLDLPAFPDTLAFLLSGVLTIACETKNNDWQAILDLVADATPYTSAQDLAKNVRSYLHLLCILPEALLPYVTPATCLTLVSRDSHNSFGIRSLDDNGSEMFGFGVWPLASYFNHSCGPNVGKKRTGRAWEFWANRDIQAGEELCISYMGGDEMELGLAERRNRSEDIWGFVCGCTRCMAEEEEIEGTSVGSDGVC